MSHRLNHRFPAPIGAAHGARRLLALALVLAGCASLAAQAHPELVIACDAEGRLCVDFDDSAPFALPASRFPGVDGHADGMPGFLSRTEAAPSGERLPPDPRSDLEFVLLGADEGLGVYDDHGRAPLGTGGTWHLGNPPFDMHPVWNLRGSRPGAVYGLRLQLRDRAGRHAASAVFTPRFTADDATALYACPMNCELGRFAEAPGSCAVCGMDLKLVSAREHRVEITTLDPATGEPTRPQAGVPCRLEFVVQAPDGSRLRDFERVHEKLMHLLIVSDDLSWFAHEHPERLADGSFVLDLVFPHGGGHVLYHDFTPPRIGMQVVPVELDVAGEVPFPVPLVPSAPGEVLVDGYTVALALPPRLTALDNVPLRVRISRDGQPVTDLQPFLGALGHLIVISEDRQRFVHSHPLELPRAAGAGAAVAGATPAGPADPGASAVGAPRAAAGPEIVFRALFPAAGRYKAWAQCQHAGAVLTAPFVFDVASPWDVEVTGER